MLRLENIHKAFGPIAVLKGIDLTLAPGQVLGLIGENGAGKSTLMNILGGLFPPTSGRMYFEEAPYRPQSPKEALDHGIAFIHQELNLFPNLTIRENLFISDLPGKNGLFRSFISLKKMEERAKALLDKVGLRMPPNVPVGELTNAQQQLVEIAKALGTTPQLIIFDEPTTALSRHESERLFDLIINLKAKNIAIIYISHSLEDVLHLADRIAVLRDGALVSSGPKGEYTKALLVRDMVGRDLDQYYPDRKVTATGETVLEVDRLTGYGFRDVSFSVRKKEVLGIYGLVGAGRSELARAIFGLDTVTEGVLKWQGQVVRRLKPHGWIKRGLVFLSEDRREEGLLLSKSIRQNIRLAALPDYASRWFGWIDYTSANREAALKSTATRIKYNDLDDQEVRTLSGGNQQKVVLSKWLMTEPQLLILDEPTKGVDIGAKKEIYILINRLIERGAGVLLISSEIEELLGMCDRMLVMGEGTIKGAFERDQLDRSAILEAALPDLSKRTEL